MHLVQQIFPAFNINEGATDWESSQCRTPPAFQCSLQLFLASQQEGSVSRCRVLKNSPWKMQIDGSGGSAVLLFPTTGIRKQRDPEQQKGEALRNCTFLSVTSIYAVTKMYVGAQCHHPYQQFLSFRLWSQDVLHCRLCSQLLAFPYN